MESTNAPGSRGVPTPVHALLDAAAARGPEDHAVRDRAGRWTYRETTAHSHAAAAWLRSRGVRPGDRVVAQLPTDRDLVALFLGTVRLGAVFVPLNPGMKPFHLRAVLADAEPRLTLGAEDAAEVHDALSADDVHVDSPPITPDDLAALVYTSGSTATPKGVVVPHGPMVFASQAIQQVLGYRRDDVVFCRFPMSWDYGLYKVLLSFLGGSEIVLAGEESDLQLMARIREVGASVLPVVPSLAAMIATLAARDEAPVVESRVRLVTNTGAALPAPTISALRKAFPGVRVVRQFGQTECKRITIMPPGQDEQRPDSVGPPLPGTRVLILDNAGEALPAGRVGEIVAAGPHLMAGYWRNEELTGRAFRTDPASGERRLHTGDYGRLDEDGYLYFEGRRDDMFKRKGIRMSTLEIEAAALDIPGVHAAGVVPPRGERDLGIVVAGDVAPHAVLRGLAERLEPAKVPAICKIVDALPLTAHGKTDAAGLEALLSPHRYAHLAERYGTPLYVYDLDEVETGHKALREALPDDFEIFYALKANPHPDVARALREGPFPPCRAEISSTGELDAALAAGYPAADCLYTGPGKTEAEIDDALARGVRLFSAESAADARRIGAAALRADTVAECLLRVNAGPAGAGAATGIRMTGRPSQFGFDAETLPELLPELLALPGVRIVGTHCFAVSNAEDEASLLRELEGAAALSARLAAEHHLPLGLLDLGGGFASPYALPGRRAAYPGLRAALTDALDRHLTDGSAKPRLACESGRYLVGSAGTLLTRVVNVKESRGRRFAVLDAGINVLGGLSGLGRLLPADVQPEQGATDGSAVATLVGPLCTPGDRLATEAAVGELRPGELLAIPNTGAYGVTASLLGFLSRPAPVEVVLRGGRVVSATRLQPRREPVPE